jgi:hypothetical protein
VALCQARISTKPLWGFSSSNPYHSQSRAEHPVPLNDRITSTALVSHSKMINGSILEHFRKR